MSRLILLFLIIRSLPPPSPSPHPPSPPLIDTCHSCIPPLPPYARNLPPPPSKSFASHLPPGSSSPRAPLTPPSSNTLVVGSSHYTHLPPELLQRYITTPQINTDFAF